MYKVIFVDDEITIREGLKTYIENNINGFEVCGVFSDGKNALQFLEENADSVDVVLTDIRMPIMSGIQLAREIQGHSFDTTIVFLSSFREFEYAKLAIKYNVFAYIEKPIDFYELDELFEDIRKDLITNRHQVKKEISEEEQKLLITQLLIEIYSGFFNSYEQLLSHAKRFGFNENTIKRPCAKFSIDIETEHDEWKYGKVGCEAAIQNAFKSTGINIYNIFSSNGNMDMLAVPDCFMNAYENNRFEENIKQLLEEGSAALKEIGIKVTISEQECFYDLYKLNNSNRHLLQKNKTEKLKNALNMELLSKNFKEEGKQTILEILSDLNLDNYKVDLNAFYMGTQNEDSELSYDESNEICNTTIKRSLRWISENYSKNITLSDAANHVMLSPVYYGRLFKLNVGVSFTGYLLDYRLNKARQLLKESMFNVREVSNMVGYNDVNYFIRLFRKKYGISPNKFKKQW